MAKRFFPFIFLVSISRLDDLTRRGAELYHAQQSK